MSQLRKLPTWPEGQWPGVSFVMPVLNEEQHLAAAVAAVTGQDYPGPIQVVLALGPSTDATDAIAEELANADPRIVLIRNPDCDIPHGLNAAIRASQHPIVIRVDAHCAPPADYARVGVSTLRETGAANVGGLMVAEGHRPVQQAVAKAYNSPLGLGGGTYHSGAVAGPSDSAYLGIFRREVLDEVGGYDNAVRRGEDWELNLRIRNAGYLVWFNPALKVTYWPRDTYAKLARQMHSTGVWRGALVRQIGRQTPLRYFAPGALVASFIATGLIGIADAARGLKGPQKLLRGAYLGPAAYLAFLGRTVLRSEGPWPERLRFIAVLAVMHTSWGVGFWAGLLRGGADTVDTSRLR